MKLIALLTLVVLAFAGCKHEQKSASTPNPKATEAAKVKAAAAPHATVFDKATKEEIGATLRVRIVSGGQPPRDYSAALLDWQESAGTPMFQFKNRCVLVLLRGWRGVELRTHGCSINVVRSHWEANGDNRPRSTAARLLEFDENTGLAVLSYVESYGAKSDVGYRLDRTASSASGAHAVNSSLANPVVAQDPSASVSMEVGKFESKDGKHGNLRLPDSHNHWDESPLCVSASGKLLGFFSQGDSGEVDWIPIGQLKVEFPAPVLKPQSIAFGTPSLGQIPFAISTEETTPDRTPRTVVMAAVNSTATSAPGAPDMAEPFQVIESMKVVHLVEKSKARWKGFLELPAEHESERNYTVQLGWTAFPDEAVASISGRPFAVKLKREGPGVIAEVQGIKNLNEAIMAKKGLEYKFPVEAKVRDLQEIAGGREVLMQLDGPPFWKRFSFTRNDWMPLPKGDLSNVFLTGNLSHLYVLDRGAAEVRGYALDDLAPSASAKLPTGRDYVAVLAGCNGDLAPVHVLIKDSAMSLDAGTLRALNVPPPFDRFGDRLYRYEIQNRFQIAGDGLSLTAFRDGDNSGLLTFRGNEPGLQKGYFGQEKWWSDISGIGVSGAFAMDEEGWLRSVATANGEMLRFQRPPQKNANWAHWLSSAAPVIFRQVPFDPDAIPALPAQIECFAYFDSAPFAIVDTPELSQSQTGRAGMEDRRWVSLDPYSRHLGALSADRKTWVVHEVTAAPEHHQPVLLNWPDTCVSRGAEFRFQPAILEGGSFTAEFIGANKFAPIKVENGTVSFHIAADEPTSLALLALKIPGPSGSELSYPIPINVLSTYAPGTHPPAATQANSTAPPASPPVAQLPIVAPPAADPDELNAYGLSFKSLGAMKEGWKTVPATSITFKDPVQSVLGLAAGHLVLLSSARRVDFLSVQTGTIAGSSPTPEKASYYVGADALFEYDPATRTLARIGVPDGRRLKSIVMPGALRVNAIAIGADRRSPITLILEQVQGQTSAQLGNYVLTETQLDRSVIGLDPNSFQGSGWAQPKLYKETGSRAFTYNPFNAGEMTDKPHRLPTSQDGLYITTPQLFIALGPKFAMAARFPDDAKDAYKLNLSPGTALGSLSGMFVSDYFGNVFRGGISDEYNSRNPVTMSPCGRYRLIRIPTHPGSMDVIEARTIENDRPLFRLGRLNLKPGESNAQIKQQIGMLSPTGPFFILAQGGASLQIVACDIPQVAKTVAPADFHVISQAPPYVMKGATLEYQIQVNNPDVVATYRLREDSSGVTVSPQGLLRYTAPQQITTPTRINFSTEVVGKDGRIVLHEFPVFVLPSPNGN